MFDKFDELARKVMSLARQECERQNAEFVGTEHILVAIVQEGSGSGAQALKNLGMSLKLLREQIEKELPNGSRGFPRLGQLPFSPRAKRAMELAVEESFRLGLDMVDTGCLLLGLHRESEGIAADVLRKLGIDYLKLKKTLSAVDPRHFFGPPASAATKKLILRLYDRVEEKIENGEVFILNGIQHRPRKPVTIYGVPSESRADVAAAVAGALKASTYLIDTEIVED